MYIAEVLAAVQTILEKMPDLKSSDPLHETAGGSLAPYDPAKYSQKWIEAGEAGQMHYLCGINFFLAEQHGQSPSRRSHVQAAGRGTHGPGHTRPPEIPLGHPWHME